MTDKRFLWQFQMIGKDWKEENSCMKDVKINSRDRKIGNDET